MEHGRPCRGADAKVRARTASDACVFVPITGGAARADQGLAATGRLARSRHKSPSALPSALNYCAPLTSELWATCKPILSAQGGVGACAANSGRLGPFGLLHLRQLWLGGKLARPELPLRLTGPFPPFLVLPSPSVLAASRCLHLPQHRCRHSFPAPQAPSAEAGSPAPTASRTANSTPWRRHVRHRSAPTIASRWPPL